MAIVVDRVVDRVVDNFMLDFSDTIDDTTFSIEYMGGALCAKRTVKVMGEPLGLESLRSVINRDDPLLKSPYYQGIRDFCDSTEQIARHRREF